MDKSVTSRIRKDGFWAVIVSVVKYVGELLFGDFVVNMLKGIMFGDWISNLILWSMNNQRLSTLLMLLFALIFFLSLDFLPSLIKKFRPKDISVNFIPRDGKIYEGIWDGYFTWLEIDGVFDTNVFTAVLKKLESEKNGIVINHLIGITKSSKPRLKIDEEKVFISKSNIAGGDVQIFLNKGESKTLPENIGRFYFEVELLRDEKHIEDFKGYLVDGHPNWKIESSK